MYGFVDDPGVSTLCRRAQLQCNGIKVCEHFDHKLLENCERYEPDPEGMKELWNHELDANARESNSITNILTRYVFHSSFIISYRDLHDTNLNTVLSFYKTIMQTKCSISCEGIPKLRLLGNVGLVCLSFVLVVLRLTFLSLP